MILEIIQTAAAAAAADDCQSMGINVYVLQLLPTPQFVFVIYQSIRYDIVMSNGNFWEQENNNQNCWYILKLDSMH